MKAEELFKDPWLKMYLEAMLIDPNTPAETFSELFGVEEKELERYKIEFYTDWTLPRLVLYSKLQKIKDKVERDIKLKVFKYGWEWIASSLNYGKSIDAVNVGDKITRSMLSRLTFLSNKDNIKPSDFKMFKELYNMAMSKKKINVVENNNDELAVILSSLAESVDDKIKDIVEETNITPEMKERYNKLEEKKKEEERLKQLLTTEEESEE